MNPWLTLPLDDYEGHMGSADVNQLAPLADLFGEALAHLRPRSVAVLGVAGGNGLEHDGTMPVALCEKGIGRPAKQLGEGVGYAVGKTLRLMVDRKIDEGRIQGKRGFLAVFALGRKCAVE